MTENTLEQDFIKRLTEDLSYDEYLFGPEILPDGERPLRESLKDPVLWDRVYETMKRLNPGVPEGILMEAMRKIRSMQTIDMMAANREFHEWLVDGVKVDYQSERGETVGEIVKIFDTKDFSRNTLTVVNQLSVEKDEEFLAVDGERTRRADVVVYVNGFPLIVVEMKSAMSESATVEKAFAQVQTYKREIPLLFVYNALIVITDGFDARYGSLSSTWDRYMIWKTKDGKSEAGKTKPQLYTMIEGMLGREVLMDLIVHYTVFEQDKKQDPETGVVTSILIKKIAAYHQYYAVKKALISTRDAADGGSHKAGVVWHTQGSGKSLSMVFYAGELIRNLDNPTIVLITDRNDLDEQLYGTFYGVRKFLRQVPVQADSTARLKELLQTSGGGVIFTTIQKFSPEDEMDEFDLLTNRENVVVIADEAHRSQYGFEAKTSYRTTDERRRAITTYGFAKYLRDAIPNATFIGFTGTPIEKADASTPAVFGNYIDVYDIQQAVEDGATVPIYYESRLIRVKFDSAVKEELDETVEDIMESEEATLSEKAKAKWTQVEAVVGNQERLQDLARDMVNHFESRCEIADGKGMMVTMSRRIAVELYDEIINLRPEWHSDDLMSGAIKVIMTSTASDPEHFQPHHTTKKQRKELAKRLKDPKDPLKMVIVRDMWLTGFDAPCLHTMYIDKPMKGHGLMQAIARVNRKFKDKQGGLVVDYIGILSDLKRAMNDYTESGGKGDPAMYLEQAVGVLQEKFEVVLRMFHGFAYNLNEYLTAVPERKLEIILEAEEYILSLPDGKKRFINEVTALSKAYSLAKTSDFGMSVKERVAFFQAVKSRLVKLSARGSGMSYAEIDTTIRQLVDKALQVDGVLDVFEAAGIEKPEISILSDDFLDEVRAMKLKNMAVELLQKLLEDQIKAKLQINIVKERKFSDQLEEAVGRYQNNMITSVEVIEELIRIAKEFREEEARHEDLGLSPEELAFYDALADNESAKQVLQDEVLRRLAHELVEKIRANVSIDWTQREAVRASLRRMVKRLLRKYGYPPDLQAQATELILRQSEKFTEWSVITEM